jgi:twitching motility protein PilJ
MKRSGDTKQATGLLRLASVFVILAALAVVAMLASFWMVNNHAKHDREYISRAEAVRVLSQSLAKNASEAAATGNTDAFSFLEFDRRAAEEHIEVLAKGNPATGLPATAEAYEPAGAALERMLRPWGEMRGHVDTILARRDEVVQVNELFEEFRGSVPQLQRQMEELATRLVASTAGRDQVHAATRGLMYAERVGRHLGEMIRGGMGNITAAERLGSTTEELRMLVDALEQGDAQLGVTRVTDARARQLLAGIRTQVEGIQQSVGAMLGHSPELFRVRDAASRTFELSEQQLHMTNFLIHRYNQAVEARLIKDWHGFGFGALSLLFVMLGGFIAWRQSLGEVAVKEAEKARLDAQAKRNQEAILNLLDEIEGLKEGDLTVQATVGEEITGAIGDAFNDAIDALRSLVTTINETSVQVSSAAQQTQATAMHLAEASDHQAHQITAASAAVNEMAVSIDQVSKNAAESARVAQQSVDLALKGADTVNRTIQGMDSIREQIQETSKRIKRLGESSQEIGNIVELINDIADQTNILALNASIQAAMAGESGRGFAVVADEVQRLAERSGNATKQIEALVKTIQTDTNEAVISMEQSTAGVVSGARLAEDAGGALREIEGVSKQLAGLIQNISEAARQQANAAANISDTMNVIQEITSQTSAGTNETATSIGNLADLANDLRNSVAGFKLPD